MYENRNISYRQHNYDNLEMIKAIEQMKELRR
jgi:hypothetical protein